MEAQRLAENDARPLTRKMVEPFFSALTLPIVWAHQRYAFKNDSDGDSSRFGKRTKASAINDYIWSEIGTVLSRIPGSSRHELQQFKFVKMDGGVIIRFKKVNPRTRRTSNVPTRQQRLLLSGNFDLFDEDIKHLVTVGYTENDLGRLDKFYLLEHIGPRVSWFVVMDLNDNLVDSGNGPSDLFLEDDQEHSVTITRRR